MVISNNFTTPSDKKVFFTYFLLLMGYVTFILYGSLVPIRIGPLAFDQAIATFLIEITRPMPPISRSDFVANFFLFAPLTFLAMGTAMPTGKGRMFPLIAFLIWLGACLLGLGIEFIQVFFPARTVSRMDVFAQAIGAFWGILLWIALAKPLTDKVRTFWQNRIAGRPLVMLLMIYTLALTIHLLLPLDLTLSPFGLYRKFKFGGIVLIPFSEPQSLNFDFLLIRITRMLPVGLLFALLTTHRENFPITAALTGSCLFASLLEFLQLFVESRSTHTTDILLAAFAGFLAGTTLKLYRKIHPPLPEGVAKISGSSFSCHPRAGGDPDAT